MLCRLSLLALLSGCVDCAPGPPEVTAPEDAPRIALTFDDLPYQTRRSGEPLSGEPADWAATSQAILDALAAADAPATVFVNCGNLAEDDTLVARWRAAGHAIGNHTAHHRSAAHTELDAWMADVRQCDGLWPAGSDETRWFRFPFLWRGEGGDRRGATMGALAEAGYTVSPVTVDTHDWMFEFVHRRSTGDGATPDELATLGDRYVQNTAEAVAEARAISREKLGREAAQIMLLHVNRVTAEQLPRILDDLAREGVVVVPLSEAMADPLYQQPDAWDGAGGRPWLARVEPLERPDGLPWYQDRQGALGELLGWP